MTEPAARRRLREAREEATAERLAAEATDCTMACVMGHTNEPGCLYDTTGGAENVPDDLLQAAYRELQRTDREFPAQTLTLARDVLAVVLPLHEEYVRAAVAVELEDQAHAAAVRDVNGPDCVEAATWTRAAQTVRGGFDA